MTWLGRALACLAAASIAACATLAGLEEPDPVSGEDGSSQEAGSSTLPDRAAPQPGDDGSTTQDSGLEDAPVDAASGDGCALGQNRDPCARASDCCSRRCGERRECVSTCKTQGTGCDPTSTSSCCVGLWCSAGTFQCVPCIVSGQSAAQPAGFPLASSCCSRALKVASTECQ